MREYGFADLLLVLFLSMLIIEPATSQMAPKNDHAGNPVSIVRNDSTNSVAIEYRNANEWQQIKLEAGKDTSITGDRVRVSTTREDNAVVTVDLPILPGKKYRLLWNTQAGIWDFSSAS